LLGISFSAWAGSPGFNGTPMATEDRLQYPGWWPTKGAPAREEYVGPAACAACHAEKTTAQGKSPMAHALMPAAQSGILRSHERLSFRIGSYNYQIEQTKEGSVYSVADGARSISAPLDWAFGFDEVGQTYLFRRKGVFYESRLSYYKTLDGLDFTAGHPRRAPSSLENALGRSVDVAEARLCFGCHATAATTSSRLDLNRLIPGVTCEACHGPGSAHVAAMKRGKAEQSEKLIFNPRGLDPVDSVEFCGACHRSFWDVTSPELAGITDIRFQSYRLETSRCWGKHDARMTCVACHDPHQTLLRDLRSYDTQCLHCHVATGGSKASRDHPGAACRVSANDCVTCHMPRYEISGMHSKFTDHRIRIVRKGAPFLP
jgi:hypothetical protein